jgi:hypothetical protein
MSQGHLPDLLVVVSRKVMMPLARVERTGRGERLKSIQIR